jgi:ankyrin repeat protein
VNGSSRAISRNNSRQTISRGSSSRSPSVNGSHRAFSRGGSHRTAAVRSSNHVPVGAQTDRRWRKANIVEIITKYIPRLNGKPTSPNVAAYPDIPDQAPDSPSSPTEELFNNLINQNMLQHDSEDANTDHLTPSDVGIAEGEPPEFQLPTEFQISPSPVVNAGDNAKVWDFLYQGADPESAELGLAILHGQEQVVQTLLVLGTDPDGRNQAKQTPLHLAVKEGRIAIVEILLQHGADVNAFDCCQWTSLHIAVRWGVCTQILQSLLEHGADVNARNEDSNTPLHFAANWGAVGAMQMLLEHGANANAENRFCLTPLEGAISSARDMAIVAILLKHGADTDLRSKDGNTVLHTAIFLGVNGIVGLLLANEVEITAHNRHGHTPLEVAVSYGNTEAVELLIGHDRNAAVQVIRQGKLLREALKYRRLPIAKLLLQNGASVNEVDENLETGLHWASRTGNIEAADFLLRNRADINARNLSRRTPIQIARDNGHDPLVGWLLLKGAKDISTDRAARGVMSAGTQTPLPALPGEPDMWDWPPSDPGNNYLLKLVKELTGDWSL